MYLKWCGASRVAIGRRCVAFGYPLKDMDKVFHHHIPVLLKGYFKQYFERISCPLVVLLFRNGRPSRFVRLVLERFVLFQP